MEGEGGRDGNRNTKWSMRITRLNLRPHAVASHSLVKLGIGRLAVGTVLADRTGAKMAGVFAVVDRI